MDMDDWLGAAEHVPGWTRGDEARELFRRTLALPADAVVVEIGTFMGGGATVMGGARQSAGSGKVHCVDPFDLSGDSYSVPFYEDIVARHGGGRLRDYFDANMRNAGLSDWVEAHEGRAVDVAAGWTAPIDLLFLDGDQSPAGARAAYEAWLPFMKPGAVIGVHNSSAGPRDLDHYGMVMIVGTLAFHEDFADVEVIGTTTFATRRDVRPVRTPRAGPLVKFVQTCDADVYYDLLYQSARTVREYCRIHGYDYESYVGIKRGCHPWQASFNQLYMLKELADRGAHDWVAYLDADAYVADLGFDLPAFLADKAACGAILTPAHLDGPWWDINSGVLIVNLRHAAGRKLIDEWLDAFERVYSDQVLERSKIVFTSPHDQDMLQSVLQRFEAELRPHVHLDDRAVLNAPEARFIRQVLRAFEPNLSARIELVRNFADALLADQQDPGERRLAAEAEDVEEFLGSAYELILGRSVDDSGRNTYRELLALSGARAGALHVVRALLRSEEFRARAGQLHAD